MLTCITGKMGSGKSTVLKILKDAGYNVFETDKYVELIYEKGQIGYDLIRENFGNYYVNALRVDKKRLGKLVFSSESELTKLNNLMLPVIKQKLVKLDIPGTKTFVELAIYMNHEEYFKGIFDKIVLVETDPEKLDKNNLGNHFFYKKNKNPIKNKKIFFHFYLANLGSFEELKKEVLENIRFL